MKKLIIKTLIIAAMTVMVSCDKLLTPREDGRIAIWFEREFFSMTKAGNSEIPDSNSFVLNVINSNGETLYDGKYGDAPEYIIASPGKYTITAKSSEFKAPAFSSPQWGDSQTITVESGKTTNAKLTCRQTNAGVMLKISSKFLTAYPGGSLLLKSDSGKLIYSYSEKRIAYFKPGNVSLILSEGAQDIVLLTRDLAARDMLTLNISVSSSSNSTESSTDGRISIQIDTARNWMYEKYIIGETGNGSNSEIDNPYSVSEAKNSIGAEDVWVYGYIVGGDLSSSNASFETPFTSRTNMVIAAKSSVKEKSSCLSVQLQKGDIRDALNLVDNPSNLKKTVYLKGDIVESYYGIPGIQNITEYQLK